MLFMSQNRVEALIEEDLHLMDLTVESLGIGNRPGRVECFPKESCVIAGVEEAARIFQAAGASVETGARSGDTLEGGEVCLAARGTAAQLHSVYKVAQNVMEYCSGIATRTRKMVEKARGAAPAVEVAVTRKHFPGTKPLSVGAALAGGASPHRLGLSESLLIFDQHRVFMTEEEFLKVLPEMASRNPEKRVMVEVSSTEEALTFAKAGAQVLQCERFSPEALADCVKRVRAVSPEVRVTAAGGVTGENADVFAAAGVDALVTSWVYFGRPQDIKMRFQAE